MLEDQHRRLKVWGSLLAALGLVVLAGLGFMVNRSLRVNQASKAASGITASQASREGGPITAPALAIHDASGACRAWLGPRDGGLYLDLMDQDGKARTTLGLNQEGDPSFKLYDRDQKLRAELALSSDGDPGLSLVDQAGLLRVGLGHIDPRYQAPEEIRERPLSSLVIFNQDGVPVWQAPLHWRR